MEYKLSLLHALEARLLTDNIALTILLILAQVVMPIFFLISLKGKTVLRILLAVTFVFVMFSSALSVVNNGWQITDKTFHLKNFSTVTDIDIKSMNIGLVDANGGWKAWQRHSGMDAPYLYIGRFRLNNDHRAVVFTHYKPKQLLVISDGKEYYTIGHPGIEKLYAELVRLGAKEGEFDK